MLPLLILFLLPGGSMAAGLLFWMLAFLSVLLVWFILGRPADEELNSCELIGSFEVLYHV
jgi:hypothetical protein